MFNPFKYFKSKKELIEIIDKYKDGINVLVEQKDEAEEKYNTLFHKSTAEAVLEDLLKEPLTYYDIDSKKRNERVDYYEEAQRILKSNVYKNEFQGIVKNIIYHIAEKSMSHEETQGLRMSINFGKVLDERLNNISDPKKLEPTKENIHSTI